MKNLAKTWVEQNVNMEELESKITNRFESNEYGMNEEQTERGMFCQEIISDAYTRWTNFELLKLYGIVDKDVEISEEVRGEHEEDHIKLLNMFGTLVTEELNNLKTLTGTFHLDWETPLSHNTDNYYGICYKERIA